MNIRKVTCKYQPGGWDKVGQGLRSRQGPFSYLEAEHNGQKAEFVTENQCFKWMWEAPVRAEQLRQDVRAYFESWNDPKGPYTWEVITDNGKYSCD